MAKPKAAPKAARVTDERAYWKGSLTFGPLVQIPVALLRSEKDADRLELNGHHGPSCKEAGEAKIGGRLRTKPQAMTVTVTDEGESIVQTEHVGWCEACGESVADTEKIRGYQGHPIDETKIDELPVGTKSVIELDRIVDMVDLAPYLAERSFWIDPEMPGLSAYALLLRLLDGEQKVAIGRVTLGSYTSLASVFPFEGALLLTTLRWPEYVKAEAGGKIATAIAAVPIGDQLLEAGRMLMKALEGPYEPSRYEDEYGAALRSYLATVVSGAAYEPKAVATGESAGPTDLLAALQASIAKVA